MIGGFATTIIRRVLGCLSDVVYPRCCPICNASDLPAGVHACSTCGEAVRAWTSLPYCPRCGLTVAAVTAKQGHCSSCYARHVPYRRLVRATELALVRDLVHQYKYRGQLELVHLFASALSDAIRGAGWAGSVDAAAVVPTHWRNQVWRRYYPAGELARLAAKQTGMKLLPLLCRTRPTQRQARLRSLTQRALNIRGAFAPAPGVVLNKAHICLIDDVMTTGATIMEAARALRQAGAAEVSVAILARTCPDSDKRDAVMRGAGPAKT